MDKQSGIDRRGFLAGTVALGAAGVGTEAAAQPINQSVREVTMSTAMIDGLEVTYTTQGAFLNSGAHR